MSSKKSVKSLLRGLPWRRLLHSSLVVGGGWTFVGIATIALNYVSDRSDYWSDAPFPSLEQVRGNLEVAWLWAALTPAVFWLSRRFPIGRRRWPRNLALHVLFSVLAGVVETLIFAIISPPAGSLMIPSVAWRFSRGYVLDFMRYFALLAIGSAMSYYRLYVNRRVRASRLETQLLESRLRALEIQLHPHFLFNALNTVSSLVRAGDGPSAVRMLAAMGDLLRSLLDSTPGQEVPLEHEMAYVTRYLDIVQMRFKDRLTTVVKLEPATTGALVPRFILQPLVENAVRHGIEPSVGSGRVEIRVERRDGMLWMQVRDSGGRLPPGGAPPESRGVGLANTRARLRHLYGREHRFELKLDGDGGTLALVAFPYHQQPFRTPLPYVP